MGPRRWTWDAQNGVYRDSSTRQLATPQPDGSWTYTDPAASTSRIPLDYAESTPPPFIPLLRLLRSSPASTDAPSLVALDPAQVLAIGRDKSFNPQIRIKDILISKTHATLFWLPDDPASLHDHSRSTGYWAIADCGSLHGTFVGEQRLSDSRVASLPRRLHHGNIIKIAAHSFSVHLHSSLPCASCTLDSSNSTPLSSTTPQLLPLSTTSNTAQSESIAIKTKSEKGLLLREAIKDLKAKYLLELVPFTPPPSSAPPPLASSAPPPASTSTVYRDRADQRRKLGPSPNPRVKSRLPSTPPIIQSTPFQADSRGAQMLSKLTARSPVPSATPLVASTLVSQTTEGSRRLGQLVTARSIPTARGDSRPGLGSAPLVTVEQGEVLGKRDWREDVREQSRKRFRDLS